MDNIAGQRRPGQVDPGVLVDLTNIPDPAIRAQERRTLMQHADQVNAGLRTRGIEPIPLAFVE